MQVIVPLQEKNAPVSETLPNKTRGVVDLSRRLVQIAQALAKSEYANFPNIASQIEDAAGAVENASNGLSHAMQELRVSTDRKRHWRLFLDSCSTISSKTILLLKIVYGADFLRIFDQCEMAKRALDRVEPKKAPTAPQEFCNNASAAATAINELGAFIDAKAEDDDLSPLVRQHLHDGAQKLRDDSNRLIGEANELLKDRSNDDKQERVEELKREIHDAIDRALQPIRDIERALNDDESEFLNLGNDSDGVELREDAAAREAELRNRDRMLRESRSTAHLWDEDAMARSQGQRDALEKLRRAVEDGEADRADALMDDIRQNQVALQESANKAARDADSPEKREAISAAVNRIEALLPPDLKHAATAVEDVENPELLAAYHLADNELLRALDELEDAVRSPGAELAALARAQKRRLDDVQESARDGDARDVACTAKNIDAANRRMKEIADAEATLSASPDRRHEISESLTNLDRMLAVDAASALEVLEHPEDRRAREELERATQGAKHALDALLAAVGGCGGGANATELNAVGELEALELAALQRAAEDQDDEAMRARASKVRQLQDRLGPLAAAAARDTDDPARQQRLAEQAAELERLIAALDADAHDDDLPLAAKSQRVRDNAHAAQEALRRMLSEAAAKPLSDLEKQRVDVRALAAAATRPDAQDAAMRAHRLADRQKALRDHATAFAEASENPLLRKDVASALDQVDMLLPPMLAAAVEVLDEPLDRKRRMQMDEKLNDVNGALNTLEDVLKGNRADMDEALRRQRALERKRAVALLERIAPALMFAAQKIEAEPEDVNHRRTLQKLMNALDEPLVPFRSGDAGDRVVALARRAKTESDNLSEAAAKHDQAGVIQAAKSATRANSELLPAARELAATNTEDPLRRKALADAIDLVEALLPQQLRTAKEALAADGDDPLPERRLRNVNRQAADALDHLAELARPDTETLLAELARRTVEDVAEAYKAGTNGDEPLARKAGNRARNHGEQFASHCRDIAEGLDPQRREAVADKLSMLKKQLDDVPALSKALAGSPADATARQALAAQQKAIERTLQEILDETYANPIAAVQKERRDLRALVTGARTDDPKEVAAKTKQVAADNQALLEMVDRLVADENEDPLRRRRLKEASQALRALLPAVVKASGAVLAAQRDEEAQEQLRAASKAMEEPLAEIEAALRGSPDAELAALAAREQAAIGRVRGSAAAGDPAGAAKSTQESQDAHRSLIQKARQVAESDALAGHPHHQKKLRQAIRDADTMMRQLPDRASQAAASPQDPALQAQLRNCADQLSSKIDEIVQHAARPNTEADAEASVTVGNDLVASLGLAAGSKLDLSALLSAAGDLADLLRGLITDANKDAAALGDHSALDLERLLQAIQDASKKATSQSSAEDLATLLARLNQLSDKVRASKERPAIAKPAENPTTFEGKVMAAAHEIIHVTDKLADSELLSTHDLALELVKLANAAKAGDRTQIIASGRAIAAYISKLCLEIKAIAARCKDKRLQDRLVRLASSLRDLSIQLKILCAMKAAAAEEQASDADLQIVSCVRNLSRSLTNTVDVISIAEKTGVLLK